MNDKRKEKKKGQLGKIKYCCVGSQSRSGRDEEVSILTNSEQLAIEGRIMLG